MSKRDRSVPLPSQDAPDRPAAAEPVVVASDRIALVVWLMGAFTMTVILLKDLIVSLIRSGLQNG